MKSVKIRGKRFKIVDVPAVKGRCEHPNSKGKSIHIPVEGDTLGELTVIIHEFLHAAFWDIDEDAIDTVGHDIARALWELKWRKEI